MPTGALRRHPCSGRAWEARPGCSQGEGGAVGGEQPEAQEAHLLRQPVPSCPAWCSDLAWLGRCPCALGRGTAEAGKPRSPLPVPSRPLPLNLPFPPPHPRRPTLRRLPKTIPVVASPAGAAVARSCGFRTVYELRPGQSLTLLGGRVTVQGTAGGWGAAGA